MKGDGQIKKENKTKKGFTPLHPESSSLQAGDEWQIKFESTRKPRPLGRGVTWFTLIELVIVVIIIGILAGQALPQYTRFIERSQASMAKSALVMIRFSEATHYLLHSEYTSNTTDLAVEIPEVGKLFNYTSNDDWTYTVATISGGLGFNASAKRERGVYRNSRITITNDGEISIVRNGTSDPQVVWK